MPGMSSVSEKKARSGKKRGEEGIDGVEFERTDITCGDVEASTVPGTTDTSIEVCLEVRKETEKEEKQQRTPFFKGAPA